ERLLALEQDASVLDGHVVRVLPPRSQREWTHERIEEERARTALVRRAEREQQRGREQRARLRAQPVGTREAAQHDAVGRARTQAAVQEVGRARELGPEGQREAAHEALAR